MTIDVLEKVISQLYIKLMSLVDVVVKLDEYSRSLRESYLNVLSSVYGYKEQEVESRLKIMLLKTYPGDNDTLKWKYN